MYGALDISTSGMVAQRTRLTAISANIANQDTILDSQGRLNPYRRREVFMASGSPGGEGLGVRVVEIRANQGAVRPRYDPGNPYSYTEGPLAGHVLVPDIDPVIEQVNAMDATRAYEANAAAAEATKVMMGHALRLIA